MVPKNLLLFIDIYGFYLESLSSLFAEIKINDVFNFCDLKSGSIPMRPVALDAAFYAENFDVSHAKIVRWEVGQKAS